MVRQMTKDLWDALMYDEWPTGIAVLVDFGLMDPSYPENPSPDHLGALQHVVRGGLITIEQLDEALGDGPRLTALTQVLGQPYAVTFRTPYDTMTIECEACEGTGEGRHCLGKRCDFCDGKGWVRP